MILRDWEFQVPGEKASHGWGLGHGTSPGLAVSCQQCILEGRSVPERHLGVSVSKEEGTGAWLLQMPPVPSKDLKDV